MRRRIVGRGFEGVELPQARGWRPVGGEDVELLQGGELPRRRLVSQAPARSEGPAAFGQPFGGGRGLLDRPDAQNIGRSVQFVLPPALVADSPAQNILNLTGDDEKAQVYTITLFQSLITPGAGDFVDTLLALLSWGSGGVQYQAEADFQTGTVIQLCASSIRIDVRGRGQGTIKAMAHIGYGASGERKAQFTTVMQTPLLMGAALTVSIPSFANRLQLQRTPATANFGFAFRDRLGTNYSSFQVGNGPGSGSEIFWIPSACSRIRITNGLGADIDRLCLVYGLNL